MIESVFAQPYQVELVIVNDGSKDNTQSICTKHAQSNGNICIIETENRGAGAARNLGIKVAKGDYIVFLDADDLLLCGSIDKALCKFLHESLENGVDIISTARNKIDMNLFDRPVITLPQNVDTIVGHIPDLEFWTCIYRRKYLMEKEIYFFEYREQDVESAFRWRCFANTTNIKAVKYFLRVTYLCFFLNSDKLVILKENVEADKGHMQNPISLILGCILIKDGRRLV